MNIFLRMQLFVKTLSGKTIEIECEKNESIASVRQLIEKKEGPSTANHLLYYGKKLKNGFTLLDYDITASATIHSILMLKGGGGGELSFFEFADLEKTGEKGKFSKEELPLWRKVKPGLFMEGICTYNICDAFLEQVVCTLGIIIFNFSEEESLMKLKCPICEKSIKSLSCGFNNCFWKYYGEKRLGDNNNNTKEVFNKWQKIDDNDGFIEFNGTGGNTVQWGQLIIETRSLFDGPTELKQDIQ